MMTIDAHQHFWKYDPAKLPWIGDELNVLKRDYLPHDLKPLLGQHDLDGCVAVQASQTEVETHFLLDLASENEFIKGIVGWIDLEADDLGVKLDAYTPFRKLQGFRHVLQDETDPNFILRPHFQRGLETICGRGYTYDLLIYPHQMEGALKTFSKHPNLPFVLDHMAKPLIKEGELHPWKELIVEMAQFPQLYCKLSGMVTENDWEVWEKEDFFPYLEVVFEAFGEDRVMFGSDWPVCLLAGSYQEVLEIVTSFFSNSKEEVSKKLMGGNAEKFYRLIA